MKKKVIIVLLFVLSLLCVSGHKKGEIVVNNITKLDGNNTVNLTIKNTQDGSEVLTYVYLVKLSNVMGTYFTSGDNIVTFDSTGSAKINLNSNESITIYDLPVNETFSVSQEKKDGYSLTVNNLNNSSIDGILSSNQMVEFKNSNSSVKTNPRTADNIHMIGIIFIGAMAGLAVLSMRKVRRFE